jgi:hypothetical protein
MKITDTADDMTTIDIEMTKELEDFQAYADMEGLSVNDAIVKLLTEYVESEEFYAGLESDPEAGPGNDFTPST